MNPFVADPEWGWWIILYFYLGGLAAGAYFLAMLIELWGRDEDRPLARIGYRLAFPLVAVCGILLIVDLERPERFWHMLLQSEVVDEAFAQGWPFGGWGTMIGAPMLKWWSPMSIGAWALFLFGGFSFLSFVASLWPDGRLARVLSGNWFGRAYHVVATAIGFFVAAYTGVLLAATNQPVWMANAWIGPLFLTSATSTGIAAVLLLGRWRGIAHESMERLDRADLWALALELCVFLIFLASLGGVLPLLLQTWQGLVLLFGTLVLGLLAPVWLQLGWQSLGPAALRQPDRACLAAACALVGGFLLRFGIVRAGPAVLHQFPNVQPSDLEHPLWQSWAGKGVLAGTLLVAALIFLLLARREKFARGPTIAAGAASLLLLAIVSLYSFSRALDRTLFDPLFGLTTSPEDGRLRGGGPGASAENRPGTPFLRTKIPQTGVSD